MNTEQLKKLKNWFDDYVTGFYGDDDYVNANLKLKEDHTRRVCREMLYLASQLDLNSTQMRLAEAIALLHDIGRFEQFTKYRTYTDTRSINHGLLGLEIIREKKLLDRLDPDHKKLIEDAIDYHCAREIPASVNGQTLLFSQLLRDADKLDIYYVVTEFYKQLQDDPANFKLEVEFPDLPTYSDDIIQAILAEQLLDYKKLKTLNDMRLLQVGWVYNVYFPATLKRMKKCRYLESFFDFLPKDKIITQVREKIFEYIDSRIQQDK